MTILACLILFVRERRELVVCFSVCCVFLCVCDACLRVNWFPFSLTGAPDVFAASRSFPSASPGPFYGEMEVISLA